MVSSILAHVQLQIDSLHLSSPSQAWREAWRLNWFLLRVHNLSELFFQRITAVMAIQLPSVLENSRLATGMDEKLRYCLDADILECPICREPLSLPVFQCENGHCACSSCCLRLPQQRCATCRQPTGRIRCMMVEKIIESLQVSCKHAPHGCEKMLQYNKRAEREEHEKETCKHKPLWCPHPHCKHEGPRSELPSHLVTDHGVKTLQLGSSRSALSRGTTFQMAPSTYLVMVKLEGGERMMLVHREAQVLADEFFCTTVSGASQVYNLQVQRTGEGSRQFAVYTIETSAPSIHKVMEKSCNLKECLLIPVANVNHLTDYDVKIRVVSPPVHNFPVEYLPVYDDGEFSYAPTDTETTPRRTTHTPAGGGSRRR